MKLFGVQILWGDDLSDALDRERWRGHTEAVKAILEVPKKLVYGGQAPTTQGLNEFLAAQHGQPTAILGCVFGDRDVPGLDEGTDT